MRAKLRLHDCVTGMLIRCEFISKAICILKLKRYL